MTTARFVSCLVSQNVYHTESDSINRLQYAVFSNKINSRCVAHVLQNQVIFSVHQVALIRKKQSVKDDSDPSEAARREEILQKNQRFRNRTGEVNTDMHNF